MTFSFTEVARDEYFAAISWYDSKGDDLGLAFAREIEKGIQTILQFPLAWPVLNKEIRRYGIDRFPYSILYVIRQQEILILSVLHDKRSTDY